MTAPTVKLNSGHEVSICQCPIYDDDTDTTRCQSLALASGRSTTIPAPRPFTTPSRQATGFSMAHAVCDLRCDTQSRLTCQTTATRRNVARVSPVPSRKAWSSVRSSSLSQSSGTRSTTRTRSNLSARSNSPTGASTTLICTLSTSPLLSNTSTPRCVTHPAGPTRTTRYRTATPLCPRPGRPWRPWSAMDSQRALV